MNTLGQLQAANAALPLNGISVLCVDTTVPSVLCTQALAALGAQVTFAECLEDWPNIYKRRIIRPDIVVTSSEGEKRTTVSTAVMAAMGIIVCDITTFGGTGPLRGLSLSDPELQRFSSFADYTGFPGGQAICAPGYPIDCQAAFYAAAGAIAGLIMRDRDGAGRVVDIARFDVAVNALLTFLPAAIAGSEQTRLGNRHPALAPWNIYPTAEGWIIICAPTDKQWQRLVELIGNTAPHDPQLFATAQSRLAHIEELDELISGWTINLSKSDCLSSLMEQDIPCGEIAHAGTADRAVGSMEASIPWRFTQGCSLKSLVSDQNAPDRPSPLCNLKVVEVGTNTTAPLAAKHLAALGANVTKIEAPFGDPARQSGIPHSDGNSIIFHLTNTDKRGIRLDLKAQKGRNALIDLLEEADILIDNLKPGKLAEYGLGANVLAEACPRLAHCSITGFQHCEGKIGRPAYDIIVQGSSGLMAANAVDGRPLKIGPSIADLIGAQVALVNALALARQFRLASYRHVDITMHDCVVWATSNASRAAKVSRTYNPGKRLTAELQANSQRATPLAQVLNMPQTQHRGLIKHIGDARGGLSVLETPLRIRGASIGVKRLFQNLNGLGDI